RAGERQRLREHFGVPDEFPKDRVLRDHFEHIDERIADWAKPRPDGVERAFADQLIGGPAGSRSVGAVVVIGSASKKDVSRSYDRGGFAEFRGERFEIAPKVTELRRLLAIPVYRR